MNLNAPVLLLDAAWRIDRVIGAQEAVERLVEDKVVAASEDIVAIFHSPSITVEVPAVIAVRYASGRVRADVRPPACTKQGVRRRDHHECQFVVAGVPCTRRGTSVDHLLPKSRGGPDTWENLVAACTAHNSLQKGDRTLQEMHDRYGWTLKREPFVPTRASLVTAGIRRPPPSWRLFLDAA
ncbi:MAG: HNH endonuclease [Ilumatobacteraceae bacterium]